MSDQRRLKRYSDSLKRNLGHIIEVKLQDSNKGFITVTRVKMSPDLRIASIYYTVMGEADQKEKTKEVLNRSKAFLKNELRPYITSRWMPDLRFFYDDSLEYADRINQLLKKIDNGSGTE